MIVPARGNARHKPVMLAEVLAALQPADGETYVDGTFGAGGYTSAILEAADCRVIALDRDPTAIAGGAALKTRFGERLRLVEANFSAMGEACRRFGITSVDGVVLDIGVSSMQIDEAARGFSFLRDGPLDMRMSGQGLSAAEVVNALSKDDLANVIFVFGEERRSRAIAGSIVAQRAVEPLKTTFDLVRAVERATGPQRGKDKVHPATRTFQALRIYVNAELDELPKALQEAEKLLVPGGRLVVVTFHSLEDRIVKRFLTERSGRKPAGSRHMPEQIAAGAPTFTLSFSGHKQANANETAANPRARSAKLRAARRTDAAAVTDEAH
jgi:16S rRNA (cytosine1402-N4)-methyltransferase